MQFVEEFLNLLFLNDILMFVSCLCFYSISNYIGVFTSRDAITIGALLNSLPELHTVGREHLTV